MSRSTTSKIGLLDNACHSLQRGYEIFKEGKKKQDAFLLKESIILIHHGVELSIKQLLVQTNEYLIFDNIDKAVEKLATLRKRSDMKNASTLDLLEFSEGAYTVGFGKLIDRAAIMLNIPEFLSGHSLRKKIDTLTIYRNKIVHFTIEIDIDEIVTILAELLEPFLVLLEREIKDAEFKIDCIPSIRNSAKTITEIYSERHRNNISLVENIIKKFNGQQAKGKFFGLNGKIELPYFQKIESEYRNGDIYISLIAKNDSDTWLISIHDYGAFLGYIRNSIIDLLQVREKIGLPNARLWLVFVKSSKIISGKKHLRENNIMFSSENDILEIEKSL